MNCPFKRAASPFKLIQTFSNEIKSSFMADEITEGAYQTCFKLDD